MKNQRFSRKKGGLYKLLRLFKGPLWCFSSDFPFTFTNGIFSRFHIFPDALQWYSSPIIPNPSRHFNEFLKKPPAHRPLNAKEGVFLCQESAFCHFVGIQPALTSIPDPDFWAIRHIIPAWRTCSLVFLWIALIGAPIIAILFMASQRPLDFTVFCQKVGHAPKLFGIATAAVVFAVALWQYRVLTRPDIRELFGIE